MARPPNRYASLIGRTAEDRAGVRIGQIRQVIVDDVTGRPEWVVIATGVLGARQKLVPIADADLSSALAGEAGEQRTFEPIRIAVDGKRVRSAPRVELVQGQPTQSAEETLYLHYQMIADDPPTVSTTDATESSGHAVGNPQPQPRRDPLGEIARTASAVHLDPEWLDRIIEKLGTDSSQQDREHQ